MAKIDVNGYWRKEKGKAKFWVGKYKRRKRPKSKKRLVGKKTYKVKTIRDEYGQLKGTKWV